MVDFTPEERAVIEALLEIKKARERKSPAASRREAPAE
jgi:hypothetical protein